MVLGIVGRAVLPRREKAVVVLLVSALLSLAAVIALGLDPLGAVSLFTALVARDILITGTATTLIVLSGAAGAFLSFLAGAGKKLTALMGGVGMAAGAAGTNAVAGLAGVNLGAVIAGGPVLVGGGGPLLFITSGVIAFASGNELLILTVGAAGAFFVLDPLGSRGGFLESLSFALKILVVTVLSFVGAKMLGPTVFETLSTLSVVPIVSIRGLNRG